jgi:DNA-binding NarL/FixJ family response regulator
VLSVLLASAASIGDMADELALSVATVERHLLRAMGKLNAPHGSQLWWRRSATACCPDPAVRPEPASS